MKKTNRRLMPLKFLFSTVLFIGTTCQALEQSDKQNEIMRQAEQFVMAQLDLEPDTNVGVNTVPIDPRIEIPDCAEPFTFHASSNSLQQSNVTVKASCDEQNWFLYFVVRVELTQQVVVSANALSPGSVVAMDDVKLMELDKGMLRSSTYSSIDEIVGAKVRRRIQSGQPITPQQLCFVCKGDAITIVAKSNGLQIKTSGIAQQDGNIGEQIRVQNDSSKRSINAVIESANEVIVQL